MQQLVINITDKSKAQSFISFLKQLDFIKIKGVYSEEQLFEFQNEITESLNDLKEHRVSSWKNKKVTIKHA
jgi:hypothetical protein